MRTLAADIAAKLGLNAHLIALLACLLLAADFAHAKQPNLLILYTDEHHPKTIGCYGGKIVKTPNIDWIADNGVKCTSFYATTPVCSPSRAALHHHPWIHRRNPG